MKNDIEKRELHALDNIRFVDDLKNWKGRLREWNSRMSFDKRIQWLHINGKCEGNGPEKALFYMDLADRYGDEFLFMERYGDNHHFESQVEGVLSINEMKRKILQKAFAVLANNCFRHTVEYSGFPYLLPYSEPLFSKLLWFFRPYDGLAGWDNLRPRNTNGLGKDGGEHYIGIANDFAENFILGSWQLLNDCWGRGTGQSPDKYVTDGHEREIVMLMRRLNMEGQMEGQYKPQPNVFYVMVRMCFEEAFARPVYEGNLRDKKYVADALKSLTKSGNPFARSLYLIMLYVDPE